MEIQINSLIPTPLKDKLAAKKSDVWNCSKLIFSSTQKIKIKAPSGTGKTTLVHLLYKLRFDYSGQIFWNSTNIANIKNEDLAHYRQQKISVIFQDLRLFNNLTAKENIELNRVLQTPYYEASEIDVMAQKLGVQHILNQKIGLCSYGEQQRIAIIRALIQPFEILLMDEPFSHLDKENTAIAASLIMQECTKRNAGFVLTDLDDDDLFAYTNKIVL